MSDTASQTTADLGLRHDASPELIFWRTQALNRSRRIAELERVVRNLRDALAIMEEDMDEQAEALVRARLKR